MSMQTDRAIEAVAIRLYLISYDMMLTGLMPDWEAESERCQDEYRRLAEDITEVYERERQHHKTHHDCAERRML